MTNDGALESWHQGEFVLGLLAGGRHNYKKNNLVQGKQTVDLSNVTDKYVDPWPPHLLEDASPIDGGGTN